MAVLVSPTAINGNGQLHLPLPASRKSFLRSLPPRISLVEDELNQVQLRLAAVEAQPAERLASSDPLEERFALMWHIVELLMKPERRRPRHRSATSKNAH